MEALAQHRLDEVKVRDLASHAGVSQATVFNYFPTKGHLLTHFIRLWSLQVDVVACRILVAEQSALVAPPLESLPILAPPRAIEQEHGGHLPGAIPDCRGVCG